MFLEKTFQFVVIKWGPKVLRKIARSHLLLQPFAEAFMNARTAVRMTTHKPGNSLEK